jgi:hypothetical protein
MRSLASLLQIGKGLKGNGSSLQAALGIVIEGNLEIFIFDGLTDSLTEGSCTHFISSDF